MKTIIERNLPLNSKYYLVDKNYIPLSEGCGCCCDNCGRLIANIATVKNESGKQFNIGFDCLETMLINNGLLDTSGLFEYEKVKKLLPKILRFSKVVKDYQEQLKTSQLKLSGIRFEKQTYESDYFTFYWTYENARPYNDYWKLKGLDLPFDFCIKILRNIFPKLKIEIV